MEGELAQNAAMIAVALVAAIIAVFKYLKTEAAKDKPPATTDSATVTSATFLDSKLVRELVEVIRNQTDEYSRESRKINRTRQEMTTALEESTDALLANTDAIINMVRFLRRQDPRAPHNDVE